MHRAAVDFEAQLRVLAAEGDHHIVDSDASSSALAASMHGLGMVLPSVKRRTKLLRGRPMRVCVSRRRLPAFSRRSNAAAILLPGTLPPNTSRKISERLSPTLPAARTSPKMVSSTELPRRVAKDVAGRSVAKIPDCLRRRDVHRLDPGRTVDQGINQGQP